MKKMDKKLFNTAEMLKIILDAIRGWNGKDIANLYNQNWDDRVATYIGDSLFSLEKTKL